MKERRTKEQIYYDIITAINELTPSNCKPTKLQQTAGLQYDRIMEHLKSMRTYNLIDSKYNITMKGNAFYHHWTTVIGQVYNVSQLLGYVVVAPGAKKVTIDQMEKIKECNKMLSDIIGDG